VGFDRVGDKGADLRLKLSKKRRDFPGGAIARAYPDHLGRMSVEKAALLEVRIFRDNDEAVFLPDSAHSGTGLQRGELDVGVGRRAEDVSGRADLDLEVGDRLRLRAGLPSECSE
jgi:hypothetical protein